MRDASQRQHAACEGLKATGVAGRPEEYFEALPDTGRPRILAGLEDLEALAVVNGAPPPEPPPYSSLLDVDHRKEHLERVRDWGTTPNGVFGAKVMWGYVDDPASLFPGASYVWVERRDTVRQGDLAMARDADAVVARRGSARLGPCRAGYRFSALRHLVDLLDEHDAAWSRFFDARPVLELTYEEIAGDLRGALERTLAHLGIERPNVWPPAASWRRSTAGSARRDVAAAARATARSRRYTTPCSARSPITRRTSRSARSAPAASSTSGASTTSRDPCSRTATTARRRTS